MVNYEGNSLNYKLFTNIFGYWWHIHCIDILIITKTKLVSFWHFRHWLHRKLSYWQLPMQPVTKMSTSPFRFSDADRTRNSCFIQGCHNQYIQWYFFVKKSDGNYSRNDSITIGSFPVKTIWRFSLKLYLLITHLPWASPSIWALFLYHHVFDRNTCLYNILGHFIHVFLLNMMITGWQWLSTAALRPGSEQRYVCHQGLFHMKMLYCQWNNSYYKDKTASRPPYLYNGSPYVWKDVICTETGAAMGFTKAPFVNFSVSKIFFAT